MLLFVNMASAMCMLTMFGSSAYIFIHWHTLFVVQVVKSAISATYMQTVNSRYVIFKDEKWVGPLWLSYPIRQKDISYFDILIVTVWVCKPQRSLLRLVILSVL